MKFQQKCESLSTNQHLEINTDTTEYPYAIETKLKSLINIMKPKMEILNKINIPFIEKELDRTPQELQMILERSCGCEIPDGVINVLSKELYNKSFNSMSVSEQAIIKVLSVYLMIQI